MNRHSFTGRIVWTPSMDEALRFATANGMGPKEFADEMGLSAHAVSTRKRRIGIKAKPKAWTPERDQLLRQMVKDGCSPAEMMKALDLSEKPISKRRRTLGLLSDKMIRSSRNSPVHSVKRRHPEPVEAAPRERKTHLDLGDGFSIPIFSYPIGDATVSLRRVGA